jgi:hypothetical protein
MATQTGARRVYSRQTRTSRWTPATIWSPNVIGHDVVSAVEDAVPTHTRSQLVRWWLVEDAYGYLHELKLVNGSFMEAD